MSSEISSDISLFIFFWLHSALSCRFSGHFGSKHDFYFHITLLSAWSCWPNCVWFVSLQRSISIQVISSTPTLMTARTMTIMTSRNRNTTTKAKQRHHRRHLKTEVVVGKWAPRPMVSTSPPPHHPLRIARESLQAIIMAIWSTIKRLLQRRCLPIWPQQQQPHLHCRECRVQSVIFELPYHHHVSQVCPPPCWPPSLPQTDLTSTWTPFGPTSATGPIVNLPPKIAKHCVLTCAFTPRRNHSSVRFQTVVMKRAIHPTIVNINEDTLRIPFLPVTMMDATSLQTSQTLCKVTLRSIKGNVSGGGSLYFLTNWLLSSRLKPFLCDFENCSSSFYTRSKLEAHRRKHLASGEFPMSLTHVEDKDKPIVCTYPNCGKRFINAAGLAGHEVTHLATHNKYGAFLAEHEREKPVVCNFPNCGKRFLNTAGLAGHEVTHRNFISQNMGAIFKNLSFNQLKSLGIFSATNNMKQQQQSNSVSSAQQQQQALQLQHAQLLLSAVQKGAEAQNKSKPVNGNGEVIVLDIWDDESVPTGSNHIALFTESRHYYHPASVYINRIQHHRKSSQPFIYNHSSISHNCTNTQKKYWSHTTNAKHGKMLQFILAKLENPYPYTRYLRSKIRDFNWKFN